MNIWYLSAYDQPRGQSSRTYDFARELAKRGHQVTVFANSYCHWTHVELLGPGEKWRVEQIDGIRAVWLRTFHYHGNGWQRGVNMLTNIYRAFQTARALPDRPDVVIGPSVPIGTGWAAARLASRMNAAFVYEVRDVWPIVLVYDGGLSKKNPVFCVFRAIEKSLYRNAQRISATMPFLFDHVAESGSDPAKVTWIPNGVDFARFDGLPAYTGGGRGPLIVMYVGGFGVAHDVITVVRAAALLQQQRDDRFRFVLIGAGVKRAECERQTARHVLTNLEFRDPVKKTDVPRVQMESDILLACVTDSESYRFGLNLNKIWDYFGSGRPVIFSGHAPKDPVAVSGAGFSIPPEDPRAMVDALHKLAAMTPAERVEMGVRGRRYVEAEYDMSMLGARMDRLLAQAVADKLARSTFGTRTVVGRT